MDTNYFYQNTTFRWIELLAIFVGIPLLYYFNLIPFHKSIPLLVIFFGMLFLILKDKTFNRRKLWLNGFSEWRPLLFRFILFAILSAIFIFFYSRGNLFILPREQTLLWIMIMIFYPLWSAYPQEFIYRTFFFRRYRGLVNNEHLFLILNAVLFSFSHIIFRNWLAIAMTFFGGLMFAWTYRKSNSLMVVFIEHMLYGNFIFTVGIGQYFYLPMGGIE